MGTEGRHLRSTGHTQFGSPTAGLPIVAIHSFTHSLNITYSSASLPIYCPYAVTKGLGKTLLTNTTGNSTWSSSLLNPLNSGLRKGQSNWLSPRVSIAFPDCSSKGQSRCQCGGRNGSHQKGIQEPNGMGENQNTDAPALSPA
jgi:hypothetical protein